MSYKKQPKCATAKEYVEVDNHNKTHHPIQYFFRDTVPDYFDLMKFRIETFAWGVLRRFVPKYNYSRCPTGLDPRKYYDIVSLMLHVNFKFLERFVEDEKGLEIIHWYSDEYFDCEREFVYSELTDLYFWWKNVRPQQYSELHALYKKYNSIDDDIDTSVYVNIGKEIEKWEYQLGNQDTYNLTRLVRLREWMWT